jgi:hypothetical protein
MTVALDFDTKLFVNKQPGGMFVVRDAAQNPGKVFWVGSNITGASDSAGYGQNPGAPFATVVYAETKCLTARGDTIYVLPGHTETLTSATGAAVMTLDVANLSIIGLGRSTRPAFLIDGHANNYVNVTGADTLIENCTFKSGHADVAKGVLVAAAGVTIRGCHFIENVATENFLFSVMTSAAADEMTVEDCTFISIDGSADAGIHIVGAANGVKILRNYFNASYVTSAIEAITNACLDIQIIGNQIMNPLAGDDLAGAIDLVASSTGLISDNRIYHADNTDCLTAIDGGNCGKCNNFVANEFAEEGGVAGAQST